MNTKEQFRVLYRQFLFRLMDVELLAPSAHDDSRSLFGQLGALLFTISVILLWCAFMAGVSAQGRPSAGLLWSIDRFMVSLTMLVVGVFAVLSWDSLFPDRRDVMVLSPLPIRPRTLFTAKIAAALTALLLTVLALNSLAAFAWPMLVSPYGSTLMGIMRYAAAFWVALLAAGTFLYCGVLAVQGIAAQLPRRWYLRISSVLQIAVFALLLGVFFLQPSFNSAAALRAPGNQRVLACLPSYWFMGLLSELSGVFPAVGHTVMAPLARRALTALPIAMSLAGASFLLSYRRTLRKIVEEPDLVPGSHGGIWLPRFGSAPQTALAQFVIRTLMRSRRHRVILAFYLGGGFALVVVYTDLVMSLTRRTGVDFMHRVNVPMLASSLLMLAAAVLGMRAVFSLPVELPANWLFRFTPVPAAEASRSAVRRSLLALAVFPVGAASAAALSWFWPWTLAFKHLVVLGLVGSLLTDAVLHDYWRIPFTCSFLPGKSRVHMVFAVGVIPLIWAIHKLVELEQRAMASPLGYGTMVGVLGAAAFAARRVATDSWREPDIDFEQAPADEVIVLGLNG